MSGFCPSLILSNLSINVSAPLALPKPQILNLYVIQQPHDMTVYSKSKVNIKVVLQDNKCEPMGIFSNLV